MKYSKRTEMIKSSDTRELLNIIGFDEMISFAGGLPAVEGFPIEELSIVMQDFMPRYGMKALQYGPTEGIRELRQIIADRINQNHQVSIGIDNVLITSGSQQALDILGKTFVDTGDQLLVEEPTYFSALNVFKTYEPEFIGIETDDKGPIMTDYIGKLSDKSAFGYYIPDFQNPTGRQWCMERKVAVYKAHQKMGIPLVEDCPYSEIIFEGDKIPSFLSMNNGQGVIHLGSFSKVFCPGFRLGYIIADEEVIKKCVLMKQSMDLHTPTFTQYVLLAYLEKFNLNDNIKKIIAVYKARRDRMVKAIETYMPKEVKYNIPKGGMFLWLSLPDNQDSRQLYKTALSEGIAFVAGDAFYTDQRKSSALRLNFTNMSMEQIDMGIKRLSKMIVTR